MPRREPLSKRYDKLLSIARKMAKEYEIMCESNRGEWGCEGCAMNREDMDGGSCVWWTEMYMPMVEMGVLDDE